MDVYDVISISEYRSGLLHRKLLDNGINEKIIGTINIQSCYKFSSRHVRSLSNYTIKFQPYLFQNKLSIRKPIGKLVEGLPFSAIPDVYKSGRIFHTSREVISAYGFGYANEVCIEATFYDHTLGVLRNAILGGVRRNGRFFVFAIRRKTKIGKYCGLAGWGTVLFLS